MNLQTSTPYHSEHDIVMQAKACMLRCQFIVKQTRRSPLTALQRFVESQGLALPDLPGIDENGIIARLLDPGWWRKELRCLYRRLDEHHAIAQGQVHRRSGIYVSDQGLKQVNEQKIRNRRLLSSLIAVNEDEQEYSQCLIQGGSILNCQLWVSFTVLVTPVTR